MAKPSDKKTIDLKDYTGYDCRRTLGDLRKDLSDLTSKDCHVKNISVFNPTEVKEVFSALKTNPHNPTEVKEVFSALKTNPHISNLQISSNETDKTFLSNHVSSLLKGNTTITNLDLSGSGLSTSYIFETLRPNTTLKTLNFSGNYNSWNNGERPSSWNGGKGGINSAIKHLADLLAANKTLTSLDMSSCINEPQRAQSDFDALKNALTNNHTITHLDISSNRNVTEQDLAFVSSIVERNQNEYNMGTADKSIKVMGNTDESIGDIT